MLPVALKAWGFLKGNWTWALPTIVAAAAIVWVLILDARLARCQLDALHEVAEARRLQIETAKADAERISAIAASSQIAQANLEQEKNNAQLELAQIKSSPACSSTPATSAFDRAMRVRAASDKARALQPTAPAR